MPPQPQVSFSLTNTAGIFSEQLPALDLDSSDNIQGPGSRSAQLSTHFNPAFVVVD